MTNLIGTATLTAEAVQIKQTEPAHFQAESTLTSNAIRHVFSSSGMSGNAQLAGKVVKRIITSSKATGIGRVIINAEAWRFKGIKMRMVSDSKLDYFTYHRDIPSDLKSYMPSFYDDFEIARYIRIALGSEFTRLNAIIQNLLQQHSIETSDWGLNFRESLIKSNNTSKPIEKRREKLQALLAAETFKLDNISKAIDIECETTGIPEEYQVDVLVTGQRGEPENSAEMKDTLEKIVPSHLNYGFNFSYMPWRELDMIRQNWQEVSSKTFDEVTQVPWRDLEGTGARWQTIDTMKAKVVEESYDLNKGGVINE